MTLKHTRLTVDLDSREHKKLKTYAAIHGKSMKELVTEWIHINLRSEKTPNKKTLKAIEKVQKRQDIEEIDINDLLS